MGNNGISGNLLVFILIAVVVDAAIIGLVIFFLTRYYKERYHKDQQNRADTVLLQATEKSREIELEAKDKALKVLQEA